MKENITNDLANLIIAGESETVEFKESFADEAIEAIGAFSNAAGGLLFIGIKDSGEGCGIQMGKNTLEDIAGRIFNATDPHVQPSITKALYQNRDIVVINVASSIGVPISVRGRYFRRVGRTTQRMSHQEIMQRMISANGLSWDAELEVKSTLNDLNEKHIDHFIAAVKTRGRLPIPENASNIDVLKKLELVNNNTPTRAALLLFGNNPERYFSSAFIKAGRFRSPTHIVDDREIHGALIEQVEAVMTWFRERLETEFIISGDPKREVRWEYPLEALREAAVNTIAHRDYTSSAHSQIRLYDDHLEFRNAGNLPSSLSLSELFHEHDSIPRNRKIAEAFFYAGFIERWGSGTLRIIEVLKLSKLPEPKFESSNGRFCLTFYKNTVTKLNKSNNQTLLSVRQQKIIDHIKQYGQITNTEYQEIANVSKRTASRALKELVDKDILDIQGETGRGTVYRLKGP